MKPGQSKSKGNQFENQIAKALSLWLTQNQRSDVLDRSPASGGKATAHKKAGRNFQSIAGDIISVDELGLPLTTQFVIELKHQHADSLNIANLIFQTSDAGLVAYWQKLVDECHPNRLPMLIFRQNSRPVYIALCREGVRRFQCDTLVRALVKQPRKNMYLFPFDHFLHKVSPARLQTR